MADLKKNSLALLSTTTVSLAADADTALYTVPSAVRCFLLFGYLVLGADAGTTDISIGQNGAETDFCGPSDLANINAQYDACFLMPVPIATPGSVALVKSYAAGTVIEAKVTNNAGGATNTLYLYGTLYDA